MAIFSYTHAQLTTAIQNWTEDDSSEFAAVIDDIIGMAELRIYRDIDFDFMKKHATVTGAASDQYLAKPSDFVTDRSMYVTASGTYYLMQAKPASWIRDYWPTVATESRPEYYADWDDDTWLIAPTPDTTYTFTLEYQYRPARLSSSNTTTWLSTNAPDLLLYACLTESAAFLQELGQGQEEGMLKIWEGRYQLAAQQVRNEEIKKQRRTTQRYGESIE